MAWIVPLSLLILLPERLGTVSFSVSCAAAVQAPFNRGVALLHDFWYDEAQRQFEEIIKADPGCAMAHWGVAMSDFHQIWNRPDETQHHEMGRDAEGAVAAGEDRAGTRLYRRAERLLSTRQADFQTHRAYSDAMGKLYNQYPDDVDAGAFYALSLLAATPPDDTSQTANTRRWRC